MAINTEAAVISQEEDTMHGRYMTFVLGEETYGIEIKFVTEIIGMQPVTALPHVPEHIKGIINLRGKMIPIIDMRIKFGKEPIPYNERTCVVVIDTGEVSVGLIVDQVAEVLAIQEGEIAPPPDTGRQNKYISGIGKTDDGIKLLLNCESLLMEEL
jgi:purine-binding chemotaxis protein CheW